VPRFHPANLRAAWWAFKTARRTRRLLAASGLDAALGPPPPPVLPIEAERGVRGALRRWHESCLVNAIVLQAWEAAHGRRRDLVVGITGPNGFSAHAWLQGDPVPAANEAPIDASVLQASGGKRATKPSQKANRGRHARRDDSGSPTAFNELLRRGAPEYLRDRSTRAT
jgi:Transglutaminase-like superfamily